MNNQHTDKHYYHSHIPNQNKYKFLRIFTLCTVNSTIQRLSNWKMWNAKPRIMNFFYKEIWICTRPKYRSIFYMICLVFFFSQPTSTEVWFVYERKGVRMRGKSKFHRHFAHMKNVQHATDFQTMSNKTTFRKLIIAALELERERESNSSYIYTYRN